MPIKITIREDEPIEKAIRRFKRICNKEGLRKSMKRYLEYEKPSDRRRREQKEALRRLRKAQIRKERGPRPAGGGGAAAKAGAALRERPGTVGGGYYES